jgi:hypothetical protein
MGWTRGEIAVGFSSMSKRYLFSKIFILAIGHKALPFQDQPGSYPGREVGRE